MSAQHTPGRLVAEELDQEQSVVVIDSIEAIEELLS